MHDRNKRHEILDNYIFLDSSIFDFSTEDKNVATPQLLRRAYNLRLRVGYLLGILLPCPICHKSQSKFRAAYFTAFDLLFNSLLYPSNQRLLTDSNTTYPKAQLKDEVVKLTRRKTEILVLGDIHGFHEKLYSRLRLHDSKISNFVNTQSLVILCLLSSSAMAINALPKGYSQHVGFDQLLPLNQFGFGGFLMALLFSIAFSFVYIFLLP